MIRATAPVTSASTRRSVACAAATDKHARRAVVLGLTSILPAMVSMPAFALILDEDDEELVNKAKANRKARLEKDKNITRQFLNDEGLQDKRLDKDLVPLQTGIFKLAKSGSELDSGNVKAAASTLSESWTKDFVNASKQLGGADEVVAKLESLKASASKGDLKASKKAYVALVAQIQDWTAAAGLSSRLTGI